MKRILSLAIVVITLVLLITGCSSPAPQAGKQAPDFQLPNLEGQAVSLADFRGKPVLLNFWATWCGPCVSEMPIIQAMFEESADTGLVVLAVNIGESPSAAEDFMQSGNLSFPVLLDTNQDVALKYNIRGIPTTFFIDKDGIVQEIKVGAFRSILEIKRSLNKIIPG